MNEENKKLCSKENPCWECQAKQQELLAKIENWEVRKKERIEKFEFIEAEWCNNRRSDGNKFQYSSAGHSQGYSYENCPECGKDNSLFYIHKSNEYGDKTTYLKEKKCSCKIVEEGSHKSNQIKSNQIKSNQIKSNQIKSNHQSSNSTQDTNRTNYLPWILGGIGVIPLIGIIAYFVIKNKKGGEE